MANPALKTLMDKHSTPKEVVPPHNLQAEKAILGAILLSDSVVDEVMECITPYDFYRPGHQRIFKAMAEMRGMGREIDAITLAQELEAKGQLDSCGGRMYLLDLSGEVIYSRNAVRYAKIVRNLSKLREMIEIGSQMVDMGYSPEAIENVDSIINQAMCAVTSLSLAHQSASVEVGAVLDELIKNINDYRRDFFSPPGLPFVHCTPGDLVVVAAGTGVGKTAITLNWADEWSKERRVTYFEYEMKETDLLARLICRHAGVTMESIQEGTLTIEEKQRINDAAAELRTRNLKIEEVWCTADVLMAKIRRDAQQGAQVVIVDHLGLIGFDRPRGMNEAKAIGTCVTNPLKRLAAELGITIVLLVQLNREGQREDVFPSLRHLRDSGETEQDASIVVMLWSDAKLTDISKKTMIREESGILEPHEMWSDDFSLVRASVEKNRNGRHGVHWSLFHGKNFRYEDRSSDVSVVTAIDSPLFTEVSE